MQVTNAIFTNVSKLRMFQKGIYVQDGGGREPKLSWNVHIYF